MRAVRLTIAQWQEIRAELQTEHPKSVFMLRGRMKERLGFTVREHLAFVPKMDGGYYEQEIHLDFFSEKKRTMFLMKFSEIVNK
jgi:hypothetical protein